jgi:ribokinase
MGNHIVSIGDLVLDIILPASLPVYPGEHQNLASRSTEPGGAANFIITALNLGAAVSATGTVGDDFYGERILRPMQERGAKLEHVVVVPGSTSTVVITLTDRDTGEHVFVGNYGGGDDVPYPAGMDATIDRADAIFVEGYTLAETRVVPMALRALEYAVKAGKPIYTDVGPLLHFGEKEHIQWLLRNTYLLFLTEDEAPLITEGLHDEEAYARLLVEGPEIAVVKRGPQGCKILSHNWWYDVPGFPVDTIVDTVGAGDCFDAAFMVGMLHGLDIEQCGLLANATGAANIQKIGAGANAPTCREIMHELDKVGKKVDFSC